MKYVYEFIGTFFLVFTVGMTVIDPGSAGTLAPLAIGSVLAVMVYAGAHISGGHYNPAVSLAVFIRGKLNAKDLALYWIAQLIAGVVAAYIALGMKGYPSVSAQTIEPIHGLIAEFLFTFALCFVVLNVATAKKTSGNCFYGFAIGFTVLVGAYAVGTVSGAAFNPAVALGITLMNLSLWTNLWVFIIGNFVGGAVAAYVFMPAHSNE